ncbi:MAG TPA: thioredoxin family protein [Ferruginibacter sp.]|nr:thioredoxin family protein [Ferruginibacter sp.]HRE63122.1 thioredoxin family protein [Ferruginibacter sp.]
MKQFILTAVLFTTLLNAFAQSPYITTPDPQHPKAYFLNGIISKYALINDSTFNWYNSSAAIYNPAADYKTAMENAAKNNVKLIVFGGTWCEDSHYILPKFFKLQEQANFPDANISFFAVDRNKKTIGGITEALGIINVPTIIVMKNGKETGRVVEYGKTGQWDKELAALLQ